ncbi:hypothetical protein [Micromonospora sp. NPDC048169]|uniref:hypothetical protein n=1 Tax=Micromonospora sp. NPDC048169 TaxID=3154711 RepID=UPI0033ED5BB1
MTVISEPIENIAGADNGTGFYFSAPAIRESDDGTRLITVHPLVVTAIDGVLTTPDLDPGPATVRIGQHTYHIEIPDSPTPIRLWPLVEAGLPVPPAEEATAVRNGGGVRRIAVAELDDYLAMPTPDPETVYIVPE